ncbi:MAG TPA: hypothetical protein VFH56_03385 [Acidimicrobiales bacterium]|nr:hypothetical protein [Acidimicrobiales bacterium]
MSNNTASTPLVVLDLCEHASRPNWCSEPFCPFEAKPLVFCDPELLNDH